MHHLSAVTCDNSRQEIYDTQIVWCHTANSKSAFTCSTGFNNDNCELRRLEQYRQSHYSNVNAAKVSWLRMFNTIQCSAHTQRFVVQEHSGKHQDMLAMSRLHTYHSTYHHYHRVHVLSLPPSLYKHAPSYAPSLYCTCHRNHQRKYPI